MSTDTSSAHGIAEQALNLLIADGAAAAHRAQGILDDAASSSIEKALAYAIRALVALREGSAAAAESQLADAEAGIRGCGPAPRAADLLLLARALWLRRQGRPRESATLLEALHERAEARPPVDACLIAAALGVARSMYGDDTGALDQFYQSLALARQSGQRSLLANALNNLGSFQADLYNLDDAAPLLEECLDLATQLDSRRQIIYAAGNLVRCLCQMGHSGRALAIVREQLVPRLGADDGAALQRNEEVAEVLLANGQIDEAECWLGGCASTDPMSNEMDSYRVWLQGRVMLARGRAREALQACLARQEQLAQAGELSTVAVDQLNLLQLAAEAAEQVEDHPLACRLLRQAFDKHEQLLGRAARSRQLSLQITHRLRQAEWERDAAQQMAVRLGALNATLQAQIAETERLQQQLRAQTLEDPLTGLHNCRHLMGAGAALLALMHRRSEPLAVELIDLDHFKRVNDEHGHEAGDQVLCAFAELTRRQTRTEDLACRYGGEEFVLLLPGAQATHAAARIDALLAQFRSLVFVDAAGQRFGCSFSAGVAASGRSSERLPALLERADAALYVAKESGRARVQLAPPPTS